MENSNTSDRDITISIISDLEKDAYGRRLRRDLSAHTDEQLQAEMDYLDNYIAVSSAVEEEEEDETLFEYIYGE